MSWKLVCVIAIGAAVGIAGAVVKVDSLVTLASTIVGGAIGAMQPWAARRRKGSGSDDP